MIDYRSFKTTDKSILRIRTEKIIATLTTPGTDGVEIYCADTNFPFHIKEEDRTPAEILDYIWGKVDDNERGTF